MLSYLFKKKKKFAKGLDRTVITGSCNPSPVLGVHGINKKSGSLGLKNRFSSRFSVFTVRPPGPVWFWKPWCKLYRVKLNMPLAYTNDSFYKKIYQRNWKFLFFYIYEKKNKKKDMLRTLIKFFFFKSHHSLGGCFWFVMWADWLGMRISWWWLKHTMDSEWFYYSVLKSLDFPLIFWYGRTIHNAQWIYFKLDQL